LPPFPLEGHQGATRSSMSVWLGCHDQGPIQVRWTGGINRRYRGCRSRSTRYSPVVRERAVRLVLDREKEYDLRWAATVSIAIKLGCTPETLRTWIMRVEIGSGLRSGLTSADRDGIKELERENKELRQTNEILRKASAFLPRRSSTANRNADRGKRVWSNVTSRKIAQLALDCRPDIRCDVGRVRLW
jgi:transposase